MKKLLSAAAILLFLISPVRAQDPIWLPLIVRGCGEWPTMSDWKVVVPESTTNLISHPSVEDADITAFVISNGATRARSNAQSRWGLYSLTITPHAVNNQSGVYYQITGTATTTYTFSVWVYGEDGVAYRLILIDGVPAVLATQTFTGIGGWQLVEVTGTTGANTTVRCNLVKDTGGGAVFYADGWQLEQKAYRTTYCDGDREGSEWNGAEHASTSSRSAQSRAGGRVRDLQTDYSLDIGGMVGAGTAPQTLSVDEYALLPGGELSGVKTHPRSFTLVGVIRGTSYVDLHAKRQALVLLFDPDGMPEDEDGPQPVRLRYTGAAVQKQIAAHYETGLEGSIQATDPCWWERVAIRFLADDPFWYEIGESAAVLVSSDSATFRLVAGKLKDTGQWDDLGPPGAPGTAVYTAVYTITEDDTYFYVGGDFLNFNNNGNADYVVRYNKQTGAWSPLGTGMNNMVRALVMGPDGTLYAGGHFTLADGGAAQHVASWNGAAWAAIGTGLNSNVYALAMGQDGTLYAGGIFTDRAGGGCANCLRISAWDGANWNSLSTGMNSDVHALIIGLDNTLYAGGAFTTAGGNPADYIASWDGTVWSALGTGMNNAVRALAIDASDVLSAGGSFTTSGGITTNYIAKWNGTAWTTLGSGMNNTVRSLNFGPDGMLYAGGIFTTAGGIALSERMAKWNGSSWAHMGVNLVAGADMRVIYPSKHHDPVIIRNYDVVIGFNTVGTAYFPGTLTAMNDGTTLIFPRIVIERSVGTSASLQMIRNETTGNELLFDYDLLDGEALIINLTPTQKSIVSNFFGDRLDAILAGCDFGTFVLQPGNNQVTCFVDVAGVPTMTTYMIWQDAYESYD